MNVQMTVPFKPRAKRAGTAYKRAAILAGAALVVILGAACTQKAPPPPPPPVEAPPPAPEPFAHTVTFSGETLGLIAKWYTGKSSNWTLLQEANPEIRPERINLGDVILIPRELLVQEEPLPRSAVRQAIAAAAAAPADSATGESTVKLDAGRWVEQTPDGDVAATEPDAIEPPPAEAPDEALVDELLNELAAERRGKSSEAAAKADAPAGEAPAQPEPDQVPPGEVVPDDGIGSKQAPAAEAEREELLDELLGE